MLSKVFFVSFLVVVTLILGAAMFNRSFSAEGYSPRLHKKDFSEHRVLLVTSADPSFEDDLNEWVGEGRTDYHRLSHTLKPFSILLENATDRDIIAYKLNWELKMSDGKVINHPRTPTYLMGVPRSDLYDRAMQAVKKGEKRLFTMVPTPFESKSQLSNIGSGSGASSGRMTSGSAGSQIGRPSDINSLIANLSQELNLATDITVSIDSVLFDNGAFVGPTGDQEFVKYKASITAKYDFLSDMRISVTRKNVSAVEVLNQVAKIAGQNVALPTPNAQYQPYYNFFIKFQAEEVTRARTAFGDDDKTVRVFLELLNDRWIIPFEQSQQ